MGEGELSSLATPVNFVCRSPEDEASSGAGIAKYWMERERRESEEEEEEEEVEEKEKGEQ